MRLEGQEIQTIIEKVRSFDPAAEIWLYGSRIDDQLKGGDIDLLVISSTITFSEKISILTEIKMTMGDQKIDLIVRKPELRAIDPLLHSILEKAVRIG